MSGGPQRIPDIGRSTKSRIIVGTKLSCDMTTPLFILTKPATHPSLYRWHTYNYTLYIRTQQSSVSHVSCCFETKIHGRSKHQCRRNCLNGQKWHLPIDKYKAKASISMSEKQKHLSDNTTDNTGWWTTLKWNIDQFYRAKELNTPPSKRHCPRTHKLNKLDWLVFE